MSSLVYAPSVEAHIATRDGKVYDVSADISSGQVTRVSNGLSNFDLTLTNAGRKYDGVFKKMDRVVIYMRRIRRLVVFTGYLDTVPAFSALPGSVTIHGSCTLKRLQRWSWDPNTAAAYEMLYLGDVANRADLTDGGLAKRIVKLLSQVAGWPEKQVHIGAIPSDWFTVVAGVARDLIGEATKRQLVAHVGSNGYVYGENPMEKGTMTVAGIGPGTGALPEVIGRVGVGASRADRSATAPTGTWYLTMRWPYLAQTGGAGGPHPISGVSTAAARKWWMGRRVLVVNPKTGKAVCVAAAGWGPIEVDHHSLPGAEAEQADRVASTSAAALKALGAKDGDEMHFAFAPSGMGLGPVDTSQGALVDSGGGTAGTSLGTALGNALGGKGTAVSFADTAAAWCRKHQGRDYLFGAEASATDPDPDRLDCCLTGDMLLSTDSGPTPIAEIKPGATVLSWKDGKLDWHPVVATKVQGEQPVFELRTRNRSIKATANHPFLRVAPGDRPRGADGRMGSREWRTEWCRLDELSRGDILIALDHLDEPASVQAPTLSDGTPVTPDVAWLLGVIVGDGTIQQSFTGVCVYGELRERVRRVVRETWGLEGRDYEQHGIMFSGIHLRRVLTDAGLKVKGPQKRVPDMIKAASDELRRAFLDGYHDADGHTDKRGYRSYASASRALLSEARMLHVELGDQVSNISTHQRTKPIMIKGVLVKNPLPLHTFQVYPRGARAGGARHRTMGAYRPIEADPQLRVETIKSIEPAGVEQTYDIEVADAHSFVAEGLVVHNSELVQWSHGRSGAGDFVDGSANQYRSCRPISIADAKKTKGALVFIGSSPGSIHHVGISLGDGTTAEAQSTQTGCGIFKFDAQRWNYAGLIPDLDYAGSGGTGAGGTPGSGTSVAGSDVAGSIDGGPSVGEALFNVFQWIGNTDFGGDLLGGVRALMNDKPIMDTVNSLVTAGLRSYCSAPNGDFIAWFPDYFGWWGTAGKVVIQDVELQQGFSVADSDVGLKSHWFVTGSTTGVEGFGDATSIYQQYTTAGIASVEFPALMRALFNVDVKEFDDNGRGWLREHGATPQWESMDSITGPRQEFFFAVQRFMLNWASQFTAPLPLTFMPELYPGMLAVLPAYGVQCYVQEVRHSFDLKDGAGFRTDVNGIAWSTVGRNGGVPGLPYGAPV